MANGIDLNEFWPCGLQLTVAPPKAGKGVVVAPQGGRPDVHLGHLARTSQCSISISDPCEQGVKCVNSRHFGLNLRSL